MFIESGRFEYGSKLDVRAGVDVSVVNNPNCSIVLIKHVGFDNVGYNNFTVFAGQGTNGFPPSNALICVPIQCRRIASLHNCFLLLL